MACSDVNIYVSLWPIFPTSGFFTASKDASGIILIKIIIDFETSQKRGDCELRKLRRTKTLIDAVEN